MISFTPIVTLDLGPLHVATHGVMIAVGFLIAFLLARREIIKRQLNVDVVDELGTVLIVAGFIGARVVYILTLGRDMSFLQMLKVWEGGLSSHGGYIFAILAGIAFMYWKKQKILPYADTLFPFMLLGWAIGRIGCLNTLDEWGAQTQVAWAFVIQGVSVHATQLYETLGYLLGFGVIWLISTRTRWMRVPGTATALSLMFFTAARFIIDFFRADPAEYLLFSHLVTGCIFLGALLFLIRQRLTHHTQIKK